MSLVALKKRIENYFEKHGREIMCSFALQNDNAGTFEAYLETYIQMRK